MGQNEGVGVRPERKGLRTAKCGGKMQGGNY